VYRAAFIVVAALAVSLGLLVGTLNSELASLDLLWFRLEWPLGLIVLAAVACGLLLGLVLAWLFTVLPLRARLKRAVSSAGSSTGNTLRSGTLKQLND